MNTDIYTQCIDLLYPIVCTQHADIIPYTQNLEPEVYYDFLCRIIHKNGLDTAVVNHFIYENTSESIDAMLHVLGHADIDPIIKYVHQTKLWRILLTHIDATGGMTPTHLYLCQKFLMYHSDWTLQTINNIMPYIKKCEQTPHPDFDTFLKTQYAKKPQYIYQYIQESEQNNNIPQIMPLDILVDIQQKVTIFIHNMIDYQDYHQILDTTSMFKAENLARDIMYDLSHRTYVDTTPQTQQIFKQIKPYVVAECSIAIQQHKKNIIH